MSTCLVHFLTRSCADRSVGLNLSPSFSVAGGLVAFFCVSFL